MAAPDPMKLVASYAEGRITRVELITRLALSAVDHAPAVFAPTMPSEFVDELRQLAGDLQAAERLRFFHWVSSVGEFDARAWEDQQRRLYVDGLRAWRTYFDGAR
jgi:hypothetical protein